MAGATGVAAAVAAGATVADGVGVALVGATGGVGARLGSVTWASAARCAVADVGPAGAAAGGVSALATSEPVTHSAAIAGKSRRA